MNFPVPERSLPSTPAGRPAGRGAEAQPDPFEQLALAEAAEASLLRLVLLAAGTTLILALAASLA